MKKIALLGLFLLMLSACQAAATTAPANTPADSLPSPVPGSSTPYPPAATHTLPAMDTPAPSATPAPTAANSPEPSATVTTAAGGGGLQPQAFSDCGLLPGLPGCKGPALPLSGLLALNDPANMRLVVANFQNGSAFQVSPSTPQVMSFSPSGRLLGIFEPGAPSSEAIALDAASGQQRQEANAATWPGWTPQDGLNSNPLRTAWSASGDQAWIDYQTAMLHVRFAAQPDKDVTWPVEPVPSDKIHQVIAWVPGTSLVLAEYHFGGNSMWVTGGALYTLDVKSGAIKDLKAHMRLDFPFQWNPTETGLIVLGESSDSPSMGGQRLALLNVLTGDLRFLIQEPNVMVSSLAWLADGKTVLFAGRIPGGAPAGSAFKSPGVYTIGGDGKGLTVITWPFTGFHDDAPQALPDGKHLLYFRVDEAQMTAVLRVASLDGKLDWPVTAALPIPVCIFNICPWDGVAVYRP